MLDQLSVHCGVERIGEENFPENFFPVPDKYILFQTGSEKPSQVYDHIVEVVLSIHQILKDSGFEILQIGDANDPTVPFAIDLRGQVSPRQVAFVVKNSELCITSNKFSARLCRTYDKDLILLGSNFPSNYVVKDFKKVTYLEPALQTEKWTFRDDEEFKLINQIKPEVVAQAILDSLGIKVELKQRSFFLGKKYGPPIFDFIPDMDFPQDLVGKRVNLRLDIFHRPDMVPLISNHCQFNLSIKKPIGLDFNTDNLIVLHYFCDNNPDVKFVKDCIKKGVRLVVICEEEKQINDARFKLLGIADVYRKILEEPIKSLDKSNIESIVLKSSRSYIGKGSIYPSLFHYLNNIDMGKTSGSLKDVDLEDQNFLEAKDCYYIFKQ